MHNKSFDTTEEYNQYIELDKETIFYMTDQHELWLKSNGLDGALAEFIDLEINYIDFKNLDLSQATFIDCYIHSTDFSNGQLTGAVFRECKIKSNRFLNTMLENVTFDHCKIIENNFKNANLDQSIFLNTSLAANKFSDTSLCNVDFAGSEFFKHSTLGIATSSVIKNCDMKNNNFLGVTVDYVKFENVDFSHSNFVDTIFTNCKFHEMNFDDALYSANTIGIDVLYIDYMVLKEDNPES